ncbi:hypothetical protein CYMTET_23329, partial [Cymbomonas tetramitiformis]|eukprot:gene3246-4096_t
MSHSHTQLSYARLATGAAVGSALTLAASPYVRSRIAIKLHLLKMFIAEGFLEESATSTWADWISRLKTLRLLLWIEGNHQRNVLNSGGPEACKRDPAKMFQEPLPHLKHLKQMMNLEKASEMGAMDNSPVLKDLVLVGGGHSHVHVLRMLGMAPMKGVRVTLVTRDVETPYSGMMPGHVAGLYTRAECHIDLVRMARFAKARVVHAEATGLDLAGKRVILSGRPAISYDILSINIGCSPQMCNGLASGYDAARLAGGGTSDGLDAVTPVKPIDGFSARWDAVLAKTAQWAGEQHIVIVGGGAGGIELALSIQYRLQTELRKLGKPREWARVSVVTRSRGILPSHSQGTRKIFARILRERHVKLMTGFAVERVQGNLLQSKDGRAQAFDECVWCTQGAPQQWIQSSGLGLDDAGFLTVEQTMQCKGVEDDSVFAAGDIASIIGHPRPKAGVFAVMAGMPLAENLRRKLEGRPLVKYWPQTEWLGLIGTGDGKCVASRGSLAVAEHEWLWELKDWIDRKWMYNYTEGIPLMEDKSDPTAGNKIAAVAGTEALELLKHASMRCGGCGAKVGASVLERTMQRLKHGDPSGDSPDGTGIPTRPDVLVGMDAPDDCAVVLADPDAPAGPVTVHTVDFFRSFVGDDYLFGRIAAIHAISDCHAMNAHPQTALAMAVLPLATEAVQEESLFQMMAGACEAMREAGCALGGGHTCEGQEQALGFCVSGTATSVHALLKKGGMQVGEVLVLTKAIGTGTVLAAEMRNK